MNKKYVCKICGWIYDPAEHDNVAFEDLPADWRCPAFGKARRMQPPPRGGGAFSLSSHPSA